MNRNGEFLKVTRHSLESAYAFWGVEKKIPFLCGKIEKG